MKHEIELYVNGDLYRMEVEPRDTLLKVLRDKLGLRGTKSGCDMGECGACTALIGGNPYNSCLVLAVDAHQKHVLTIEGLACGSALHPLQEEFIAHGAIQCGFCTPGMLLTAKALLDQNPNPTENEIKAALSGNLCRCTGYVSIIKAIRAAAERLQGS